MERGKVVRVVDFIMFIVLVSFFSLFSGAMLFKSDPEPLKEIFLYSLILLFNVFMIFLYIKSYKLYLNDRWFKASFIFKIISLLSPFVLFFYMLFHVKMFGSIELGGIVFVFYSVIISFFLFFISMILFIIGYVKNKKST